MIDIRKKSVRRAIKKEISFLYGQRSYLYAKNSIDIKKQIVSYKRTIELLKKVDKYIAQAI